MGSGLGVANIDGKPTLDPNRPMAAPPPDDRSSWANALDLIAQFAQDALDRARSEAAILQGTAENFPGAVASTFQGGEAIDSVKGAYDNSYLLQLLIPGLPAGSIYGNQDAYEGGAQVGSLTDEAAKQAIINRGFAAAGKLACKLGGLGGAAIKVTLRGLALKGTYDGPGRPPGPWSRATPTPSPKASSPSAARPSTC